MVWNPFLSDMSTHIYLIFIIVVSGFVVAVPPRPMDPKKDLAVYGYGSVAWKDRMEEWKKKQNDKLQLVKLQGGNSGNLDEELDDPDLPKYVHYFDHSFSIVYLFFSWGKENTTTLSHHRLVAPNRAFPKVLC